MALVLADCLYKRTSSAGAQRAQHSSCSPVLGPARHAPTEGKLTSPGGRRRMDGWIFNWYGERFISEELIPCLQRLASILSGSAELLDPGFVLNHTAQ